MHNKIDRLVFGAGKLRFSISLVFGKPLRREMNVTRFINTVDVTESSSNGKHVTNGRKGLVHVPHLLGTSVKLVLINILVVDTIFLSPVIPISVSSHIFMAANFLKYCWQIAMFSSSGSSERSSIWEEKRGSPY